jgi:phosphate butyryltransferase
MLKIDNFSSVKEEVAKVGRLKVAVLSPEDVEFMEAFKEAYNMGYITPILVGDKRKVLTAAGKVDFDVSSFQKVFESDREKIADIGAKMLFSETVDVVSKGQIPTSYIYKAMMRGEKEKGKGRKLAVLTLHEVEGRFIVITDTGVNIYPDWKMKLEALKGAIFLLNILGYEDPRILILSALREIEEDIKSKRDAELIRNELNADITIGSLIDCEGLPDIMLVPNLDTGNILAKLDFFLNVTRCSPLLTSCGPVTISSRSDDAPHIVNEIALGIVLAQRLKGMEHGI